MISAPFIFFGTSEFSVIVLETLRGRGLLPHAVVTTPDRPRGRKLVITPPPVKVWAKEQGVAVIQFDTLDGDALTTLRTIPAEFFIVASYGKIIPQLILDIPPKGALNIHPSLLPLYRGASPLQSTILADDNQTGVTIIKMDAHMDHGPIVASTEVTIENWPPHVHDLERTLAIAGAHLLADSLDEYLSGTLVPKEQDHRAATFTKKITKEDGLIDLIDTSPEAGRKAYLNIHAYEGWPGTYFYTERKGIRIRVAIKEASFIDGKLILTKVTPEGGREMSYNDFLKGF